MFVFCFSAISVELYYIFATLWGREQYTLYGILFIVFGILLSVTACISVALTYFQLSAEDYRWWWRSIFSAGYTLFSFFVVQKLGVKQSRFGKEWITSDWFGASGELNQGLWITKVVFILHFTTSIEVSAKSEH